MLGTDARTLENSDVGDITKLSLVPDQAIKCRMLESSSILELPIHDVSTSLVAPSSTRFSRFRSPNFSFSLCPQREDVFVPGGLN